MGRNVFNFEGGDFLTTIGAGWFVSYKYHESIDHSHMNWKLVKTYQNRISVFNSTKKFHEFWLSKVLEMNNDNLNRNKLNLGAKNIKEMASQLLNKK